jgi:hypothetical protein
MLHKKLPLILSSVLLTLAMTSRAQSIVAGLYDTADVYVDIVPDTSVSAAPISIAMYIHDTVKLDMDQDGVNDLIVTGSATGGLGGGLATAMIRSLRPAEVFSRAIPKVCTVYPGTTATYRMEEKLAYGDTIHYSTGISDTLAYFWADGFGSWAYPTIHDWNDGLDHYAGVELIIPGDTLFGWIDLVQVSNRLYVKQFACNRNPNVKPVKPPPPNFSSYPNPANEQVKVTTDGREGLLQFFSVEGKSLKSRPVSANNYYYTISTLDLPAGTYTLVYVTGKERIINKLSVVHP